MDSCYAYHYHLAVGSRIHILAACGIGERVEQGPKGFGTNVLQILNDHVDLGLPLSISGLRGILKKNFGDKKLVNWPIHQLGVPEEGETLEEIMLVALPKDESSRLTTPFMVKLGN